MVHQILFDECIRNGHSRQHGKRIWNIASHKLLYVTPELAKGFLNLKRFNRYRINVIGREVELIKEYTSERMHPIKEPFNLIDLGCGDGLKAASFIKSLPSHAKLRYCPMDINPYFLRIASERIRSLKSRNVRGIRPQHKDFDHLDEVIGMLRNTKFQRNVLLLLGQTLASFEINDFLFQLSKDMFKGDMLVIGNGIREGKRFVSLSKYKHPVFNEWFIHLMHGLGFKDSEIEYDVRFENSRLEFFYHINVDKIISMGKKKISFRKGDEVLVAFNYKYFANELEKFCKMYFFDVKIVVDKDHEYALAYCTK